MATGKVEDRVSLTVKRLLLFIAFLARNAVPLARVVLGSPASDAYLERLSLLIEKTDRSVFLVAIRRFLIETLAETLLQKLEHRRPAPAQIVKSREEYERILTAYSQTLEWQRQLKPRRLSITLYRAALCACRLGDINQSIQLMREALLLAGGKGRDANRVLALYLNTKTCLPEGNIWQYFAEAEVADKEGRLPVAEKQRLNYLSELLDNLPDCFN